MHSVNHRFYALVTALAFPFFIFAQLPDDCKLSFGTNLAGMADWGTELPFVDLMHNAREWYTKDIDNPNAPFNSGWADKLSYRPDGYPTHLPQEIDDTDYAQRVSTIWGRTDGWPLGSYTVLWEGTGELSLWGTIVNVEQTGDHRIIFDLVDPVDGIVELNLLSSDINDPIHNIRVLMPGTEQSYLDQPFNEDWLERLSIFPSIRFMDWGSTNGWGYTEWGQHEDPTRLEWAERAQMNHYTWATPRGIPYEMMIRLMNEYEFDGWICVPHRASADFMTQMATLFRNQLDHKRHLHVEYSNEVWNWIFDQTHWLNLHGCINQGVSWPEGVVPYIQECMDIWTEVFDGQMDRITRVAGVQAAWQDVSNRMVQNLTPGSIDAITPTFYFGFSDESDTALDQLGEVATAADIAAYARQDMAQSFEYLLRQKNELADPLGLPLVFYEGGQHLTPHPFGEEPAYAQALLDIQRDTAMQNLYVEWFGLIRTLQSGEEPLLLMNFSFIAPLSARYGSWGILESLYQDTTEVPAPKYAAILNEINACDQVLSTEAARNGVDQFVISPNPVSDILNIEGGLRQAHLQVRDQLGRVLIDREINGELPSFNVSSLPAGQYVLTIWNRKGELIQSSLFAKE
ncbi:MAG: T9SS type A sorting domain-containing protein [Bacteroidota bacterium]